MSDKTIEKEEYLKYSISNNLVLKIDWFFTFFTIYKDERLDNPYLRIAGDKTQVNIDNDWPFINIKNRDEPIFNMLEKITIEKGFLKNINEKSITTTVGRLLANKILLEYNFGDKIDFINEQFSISKVESLISEGMRIDKIKVDEYLNFTNAVTYLKGLSRIVTISATPKNILPPPNIDKIKKELINDFNNMYGKDWVKDRIKILEFKEKLKEVDKEWLKDDPTNGKLINKKIKDNARVKMHLTFGDEVGFDKTSGEVTFVPNSLGDQYPNNKEQLTAMFNSSRSGSYDRGKETQKGGAAAKDLLRSTSSYNIKKGDCGSTLGKKILVTEDNANSLNGRYFIDRNEVKKIDNGKDYLGKTLTIRSPMYCFNKDSSFCSTCCGDSMSQQPNGINLVILKVSNVLLTSSLKTMHNSNVSSLNYNILENLK